MLAKCCSVFVTICLNRLIFKQNKSINLLNSMTIASLFIVFLNTPIVSNASTTCNEKNISQRMLNFMEKYHIDGATVLIANQGKIQTCLFGDAVPAKHIPVSEDTIFELGSITKTFTGIILAQSIMSGKSQLSDSIDHDSIATLSPTLRKIKYLELATYTSGLPFNAAALPYNVSASMKNQIKLSNYLKGLAPAFQPGSHMLYSNLGFGILGQILAKKEQVSLAELMKRDILSPLKMNSAGLNINPNNQKHLAQGYTAQGKPVPYLSSGLFGGAWAMRASTKDMQAYLMAVLGEQFTSKNIHQAIQLSQRAYYDMPSEEMELGLGWLITPLNKPGGIKKLVHQPDHYNFVPYKAKKIQKPRFNPNALIGKMGATDGFRAYIAVIPAKHTGIVIMINRFIPSSGALANLANEILLKESHITI